jgi:hypothetical protein
MSPPQATTIKATKSRKAARCLVIDPSQVFLAVGPMSMRHIDTLQQPKGCFTPWLKVERPSIPTNHIARNQEFGLSTLHTMAKVQRPSQFKIITFWRRRWTLEGSLAWTWMETQTMVERLLIFFIKKSIINKILVLDWRGYFEQGIKWDAPLSLDFGLGLWRLHTMAVQVERMWEFMAKGLDFGLGLWRLHNMPGQRHHLLCFISYFQPILWTLNKVWPLNPTASWLGRS